MPDDKEPQFEYVIVFKDSLRVHVYPEAEDTKTAFQANSGAKELIAAINKMAEYGYRMVGGAPIVAGNGGFGNTDVAVIMERQHITQE